MNGRDFTTFLKDILLTLAIITVSPLYALQIQASDVIDPFQKCFLYDFIIALQPFYPFPGYLFPTS
jgi:hypothetical protein